MRGPIDVLFAFIIFSLPVPTRPATRTFCHYPTRSRPEVKNHYPSVSGQVSSAQHSHHRMPCISPASCSMSTQYCPHVRFLKPSWWMVCWLISKLTRMFRTFWVFPFSWMNLDTLCLSCMMVLKVTFLLWSNNLIGALWHCWRMARAQQLPSPRVGWFSFKLSSDFLIASLSISS